MAEDIKELLEDYKEETKRHFDVVAEDLKGEIRAVAEQVAVNTEKLDMHGQRFDKIDEKFDEINGRFGKVENDLGIIKLDIEFIKNELKQKVALDEFAALEKRVSMLEAGPK